MQESLETILKITVACGTFFGMTIAVGYGLGEIYPRLQERVDKLGGWYTNKKFIRAVRRGEPPYKDGQLYLKLDYFRK